MTDRDRSTQAVALVTGAARGLGKAVADVLAREGRALYLTDILEEELASTGAELAARGVRCSWRVADISQRSACLDTVADCVRRFGRLDILCNVAGVVHMSHAVEVTQAQWEKAVAVNMSAPFWFCQAALPELVRTHGNIVNVASVAASRGAAYLAPYAASKAGLVQMSKSLAVEFEHQPIRINVVAPGSMDTLIGADAHVPPDADAGKLQRLSGPRPSMSPHQVAEVVAFVASARGAGLNGAVIYVDGGTTAG